MFFLFLGLEEDLEDAYLGRFKTVRLIQNRKSKNENVAINNNFNRTGRIEPALRCYQEKRRKISSKVYYFFINLIHNLSIC